MDNENSVEKYKLPHESSVTWTIKRKFLLFFKDRFEEDRLLCLAQAYVNVMEMGCRYPEELMTQLKDLAAELNEEFGPNLREKNNRIDFVAGKQAHQSQSFKSDSSTFQHNISQRETLISTVKPHHMRNTLAKRKLDTESTEESDGKSLRTSANMPTVKATGSCSSAQGPKVFTLNRVNNNQLLDDFVILEEPKFNAIHVLQRSASANRAQYREEIESLPTCQYRVKVFIDDTFIGEAVGSTRKSTKEEAHNRVLARLKARQPVIRVNEADPTDGQLEVNRSDFYKTTTGGSSNSLDDDNMGKRLLQMMGWAGGGLGKEGNEGIVEPVSAADVCGTKQGIGFRGSGMQPVFKTKIERILLDYAKSENYKELAFDKKFTKDERAYIHQKAQKLNLKSKSYGKDEERYLLVSKKINVTEMLQELIRHGGVVGRFELVSLGGEEITDLVQ